MGDHITYQFIVNPRPDSPRASGCSSRPRRELVRRRTALANMQPYAWISSGSVQGPAGVTDLGTFTIAEDPLLQPIPASLLGGEIIDRDIDPGRALIDVTMPRLPRWWYGAVSPHAPMSALAADNDARRSAPPEPPSLDGDVAGTLPETDPTKPGAANIGSIYSVSVVPATLPAELTGLTTADHIVWDGVKWRIRPKFALPKIGATEMTPHPWDWYVDLSTGDVYLFTPGNPLRLAGRSWGWEHPCLLRLWPTRCGRSARPSPAQLWPTPPWVSDGDWIQVSSTSVWTEPRPEPGTAHSPRGRVDRAAGRQHPWPDWSSRDRDSVPWVCGT